MLSRSKKIVILLKINIKQDIRSWIYFVLELAIIIAGFFIILLLNYNHVFGGSETQYEAENWNNTIVNENSMEIKDISDLQKIMNGSLQNIFYYPIQETTTTIMQNVSTSLSLADDPQGFESEIQMTYNFNKNSTLAAVIFHEYTSNSLSITLRFPAPFRTLKNTNGNCWSRQCFWSSTQNMDNMGFENLYAKEGFLQLQHSIFKAWLKFYDKGAEVQLPSISFNSFQSNSENTSGSQGNASNFIWTFYYFIYFVPFLNLVWKVAKEAENGIQGHNYVYGISYMDYWFGHFLVAFVHFMIINLLILGFLMIEQSYIGAYIGQYCGSLLLFLIFHSSSLLLNAFVLATLLGKNTKSALLFATSLWLASYVIFSIKLGNSEAIDFQIVLYFLIFPNNFFPFGLQYLEEHMKEKEEDSYKFWLLLLVQMCAFVFYCCCLQFLKPRCRGCPEESKGHLQENTNNKQEFLNETTSSFFTYAHKDNNWKTFEYGPLEGHLLMLQNVSTFQNNFRSSNPSLQNISMRIFENEISVILGPNGSGKSAFISLLAGRLKYEGSIFYNHNKEISKNWSDYSTNIDVSTDHNSLYDHLTVSEQLKFVLLLKHKETDGDDALQRELNKWLLVLKPLLNHSEQIIRTLNFDQKKLVELCCILSGNTKVILLDEPTNHLELENRHMYWNILRQERKTRAIIMTTSSIDEANEIADRIGILNSGKLMAWCTPYYLRNNLSKGIYLVLLLIPETPIEPITKLLEKYISSIAIHVQFHDRIIYTLPLHKRSQFQRILMDLEKESSSLGISSMYMTGNDMNDAFMELTGAPRQSHPNKTVMSLDQSKPYPVKEPAAIADPQDRKIAMWRALLYKKLLYQSADMIPVFVIFLALLLIAAIPKMFNNFNSLERLEIGLMPNTNLDVLLRNWENCNYLEIAEIKDMGCIKFHWKPKKWLINNLKCGNEEYRKTLFTNFENRNKIGAVEKVNASSLKLWTNKQFFHAPLLVLNLAQNVMLRNLYPNEIPKVVRITSEPIWEPMRQKIAFNRNNNPHSPIIWGIILPLTISSFSVMLINERRTKMLTLQRLAGMTDVHFWLSNFVWEYAIYEMITLLYLLATNIYITDGPQGEAILVQFNLLSLYGLASLAMCYALFPCIADNEFQGFLKIFLIQIVMGVCGYLLFYWDHVDSETFWYYLFMFSPSFAILVGMGNLETESKVRQFCHDTCSRTKGCQSEENGCSFVLQCCNKSFFEWSFPGILPSVVFMSLTFLILFTILISISLYQKKKKYSPPNNIRQLKSMCYPYDDDRVIAEKVRISQMSIEDCRQYAVLVDQLEYGIPQERSHVVKVISFTLQRSDCLGIYGASKSGKTHLVRQLIGEEGFSFGEVYICGREMKKFNQKALASIGYSPQQNNATDAYFEGATPRQIFSFFFMLQTGDAETKFIENIKELSVTFSLRRYMNIRLSELPLHIKRRISFAIALIVNNQVLIFDEPTKGLDSRERQFLWTLMKRRMRENGNTIIFTSQESVELETLADFIIVINKGEMLALGSPQLLRQKYTRGFYMEIKLKMDGTTLQEIEENLQKDMENLQRFISFLHTESELIKRNGNAFKYYLPIVNVSYSYLFGTMEKNRERLNILDYMISQGSLATVLDNLNRSRKERRPYNRIEETGDISNNTITSSNRN
ncbi:ATP-binding cassette sub-family A member 17-like [Musca autumnalis]|uniref:ATP-binding cassette sub-family A member 17-like n=1 Tax=Musca autumnalis TaxID=221902 RepID=UPI003CEE3182